MRQRPKSIRPLHNAHAVGRHCSSPGCSTLPRPRAQQPLQLPARRWGWTLPCPTWEAGTQPCPRSLQSPARRRRMAALPPHPIPSHPDPDMHSQHLAAVTGVRRRHSVHPFGLVAFAGIIDKTRFKKRKVIQWQSLLHLAPDPMPPRHFKEPISLLPRETPLTAVHIKPQ